MMIEVTRAVVYSLSILFVTIFRMIFDTIDVLIALFATRHGTCEWLFI